MKNQIYKLDLLENMGQKYRQNRTVPLGKVWPMGPWELEERYEEGLV